MQIRNPHEWGRGRGFQLKSEVVSAQFSRIRDINTPALSDRKIVPQIPWSDVDWPGGTDEHGRHEESVTYVKTGSRNERIKNPHGDSESTSFQLDYEVLSAAFGENFSRCRANAVSATIKPIVATPKPASVKVEEPVGNELQERHSSNRTHQSSTR